MPKVIADSSGEPVAAKTSTRQRDDAQGVGGDRQRPAGEEHAGTTGRAKTSR